MKKHKEVTGNQEITGSPNMPKKKKRRVKKAPIIIAAAVLILFVIVRAAGCALSSVSGALVTTTQAVRGDLQESISTSGTVLSEETKVVFAPVSGRLTEVKVAAGDTVKAGDLLISYDMDRMEQTLHNASLQLAKSKAGYSGALADNTESRAKLDEAVYNLSVLEKQLTYYRNCLKDLQDSLNKNQRDTGKALAEEAYELQAQMNSLHPETVPEDAVEYSQLSSQLARNQYLQQMAGSSDYVAQMNAEIEDVQGHINACEEYKAQMESQKSASEAAVLDTYERQQLDADRELADLSYQETERDYYIAKAGITAEFDGIITECSAVPGAEVNQGLQLLTLQSSENLKVSFEASQYDIEKIRLGQSADVVVAGSTYHGKISKINRMAERNSSNTPMVGVEIHLLDGNEDIILGMDARLTIYTQKAENALLIPVEAINADRDGDFLYCVEDGTVVRKPIVCGISTDMYTEVLEGITENDQIILSSFTELSEGMPVTVMPDTVGDALPGGEGAGDLSETAD